MAIADINMSSRIKVSLCLGYTLFKFSGNWLSFVENITVLLQHVNLSHSFRKHLNFCIFGYYKAIIAEILTNFFCFHISLIDSFHFLNKQDVSDHQF